MKPITRREAIQRGGRFLIGAAACSLAPGMLGGCSNPEVDATIAASLMRSMQAVDLANIRMDGTDFDGDGDTTEGIAGELETTRAALYTAIQNYALQTAGTPIVFEPRTYPYFFNDTNGDGQADASEANFANRYARWTPRLLRAAYNFQYAMNDPGAFAHNGKYVLQVLHDSIQDLGGDVSGLVRPQTVE